MTHHFSAPRIAITIAFVLGAMIMPGGCRDTQGNDMRGFLTDYMKRRPASELIDVYKLLYQGEFGVGHIIKSEREALGYLTEEMSAMGEHAGDPLTEPCLPGAAMIRVNLRPFKAAGLDPTLLLRAMMETTESTKGTAEGFAAKWSQVGDLIDDGTLKLDIDEYNALTDDLQEQGWPMVHHSDEYAKAYKPAYRVVTAESFKKFFPGK